MAKVRIVSKKSKYTGVLSGAECGLLRLSLTYRPGPKRAVAPGLALKILRDAHPSANVSALVSLDGQGTDYNFFRNPMSNIVPVGDEFGQKIVHAIFKQASPFPEELRLHDLAAIDEHGQHQTHIVYPRQIFFVPATEFHFSPEAHDVRQDILTIKSGTILYKILAVDETSGFKYDQYRSEHIPTLLASAVHIADLVTTSDFIASQFGDSGIFFYHQLRRE